MKIFNYNSEYKNDWDTFVDKAKNSLFMHKRDFMEYHSDRFNDNSLLFFDEKNQLIALFPANIKDSILYSHQGLTYGGFITGSEIKQHKMLKCFTELNEYMKNNKIKKIIYKNIPHFYHSVPAEEDFYALFCNNARIIKVEPSSVIDLTKNVKLPKGRKAQISRAKRENVIIEESEDFNTFIKLENSVLKERHNTIAIHTGEELSYLYSKFPNNIKLFVAKHCDSIIAGVLLFVYENVVHTQYLAANEKARRIGALDLVIYETINKYKGSKHYFDFGISTENSGKTLNEGLISQKESFGGRTICYQTWELSYENKDFL